MAGLGVRILWALVCLGSTSPCAAQATPEELNLILEQCPERDGERLRRLLEVELRTMKISLERYAFALHCDNQMLLLIVKGETGNLRKRIVEASTDDRAVALTLSEVAEEMSRNQEPSPDAEHSKDHFDARNPAADSEQKWRSYWGLEGKLLFAGSVGSWSPLIGGSGFVQWQHRWEAGLDGAWGSFKFEHPDASVRQNLWWLAPTARWRHAAAWGDWYAGLKLPLGRVSWQAIPRIDGARGERVASFWSALQGELGTRLLLQRAYLGAGLQMGGVVSPASGWIGDEEVVSLQGLVWGLSLGGGVVF